MKWVVVAVGLLVVLGGAGTLLVGVVKGKKVELCQTTFTLDECRRYGNDPAAVDAEAASWTDVRAAGGWIAALGVAVAGAGAFPWGRVRRAAAAWRARRASLRAARGLERQERAAQAPAQTPTHAQEQAQAPMDHGQDPLRLLQARLARGEIGEDEYARKRLLLGLDAAPPARRPGRGAVLAWSALGGLAGGVVGFLFRPSSDLVGQLPFDVVVTRGAGLEGFDAVLKPLAERSFNVMLAGLLIGLVLGALVPSLRRARASA